MNTFKLADIVQKKVTNELSAEQCKRELALLLSFYTQHTGQKIALTLESTPLLAAVILNTQKLVNCSNQDEALTILAHSDLLPYLLGPGNCVHLIKEHAFNLDTSIEHLLGRADSFVFDVSNYATCYLLSSCPVSLYRIIEANLNHCDLYTLLCFYIVAAGFLLTNTKSYLASFPGAKDLDKGLLFSSCYRFDTSLVVAKSCAQFLIKQFDFTFY